MVLRGGMFYPRGGRLHLLLRIVITPGCYQSLGFGRST
jgi:hypothetical protein